MSITNILQKNYDELVNDVTTFKADCQKRYKLLKENELLGTEATKTIIVATVVGLTTGFLCGTPVGLIIFAATAFDAGTSGRMNSVTISASNTLKFGRELGIVSKEEACEVVYQGEEDVAPNSKVPLSLIGKVMAYVQFIPHCIKEDIKFELSNIKHRFSTVDKQLQNYVIAKVLIVASTVGLTSGLVCGPVIGLITFAVTASYVNGSVCKRLNTRSGYQERALKAGAKYGILLSEKTNTTAKSYFETYAVKFGFAMCL